MYFCPTALRLVPHESHMMAYFRRQGRNCRTSMRANTGMEQRKCTSKDRWTQLPALQAFSAAFNHIASEIDVIYKELTRSSMHPLGRVSVLWIPLEQAAGIWLRCGVPQFNAPSRYGTGPVTLHQQGAGVWPWYWVVLGPVAPCSL